MSIDKSWIFSQGGSNNWSEMTEQIGQMKHMPNKTNNQESPETQSNNVRNRLYLTAWGAHVKPDNGQKLDQSFD